MSRDDGLLATAMSSSSPTSLIPARTRQRRAEAEAAKQKPDGRAEAVLVVIAKEKEKITSITDVVFDDKTDETEQLAQLRCRKEQYLFLERLERTMQKALGVTLPEATK